MATVTYYPNPNVESTSVDGYTYRSYGVGLGVAWGTLVAADGTSSDDSSTTLYFFSMKSDTTSNQWRDMYRSIILFDTSAFDEADTITSAVLSVKGEAKADELATTPDLNIYSSNPASNTAVAAGDLDTLGSTAFSSAIAYSSLSTTAYNDFTLNASGLAAIDTAGISKFGTRNANRDVANSSPTWGSNQESYFYGASADTASTTSDPKLVITYTAAGAAGVPSSTLLFVGT